MVRRRALIVAGAALVSGCTLLYAPESDVSGGVGGAAKDDSGVATKEAGTTSKDGGPTPPLPDGASGQPYVAAVLSDRPVLYLRLSGATPTSPSDPQVRDEVSGASFATRNGDLAAAPGVLPGDSALDFRGGSLLFDDRLGFSGTAAYSIELWASSRSADRFAHIVTKQRRQSATKTGYALFFNEDHFGFERYVGGAGIGVSSEAFPLDDTFHHVVATYDGARMTLYVDGQPQRAKDDARPLGAVSEPFIIGSGDVSGENNVFNGRLDELAIYDKALAGTRVAAHFAAAK